MARSLVARRSMKSSRPTYILEQQIGFILRQVWQRHAAMFAREIGINLTPTQWAALARLSVTGPCSQNQLGRFTAMDLATIKGVIDRLTVRGLTETSADPEDGCLSCQSDPRGPAAGGESSAERARDLQGNSGAARAQGARDADRTAQQTAVRGKSKLQSEKKREPPSISTSTAPSGPWREEPSRCATATKEAAVRK